jgi:ketosteroid isomerase-like protein
LTSSRRAPAKLTRLNLLVSWGRASLAVGLNRISGTRTDGEQTDVSVRATVGLRRIGGRWQVTHEHSSVPFYMDRAAAVDLVP